MVTHWVCCWQRRELREEQSARLSVPSAQCASSQCPVPGAQCPVPSAQCASAQPLKVETTSNTFCVEHKVQCLISRTTIPPYHNNPLIPGHAWPEWVVPKEFGSGAEALRHSKCLNHHNQRLCKFFLEWRKFGAPNKQCFVLFFHSFCVKIQANEGKR